MLCFRVLGLDILTSLPIVELLTFKPFRNEPWSIFLLQGDHLLIFEYEHGSEIRLAEQRYMSNPLTASDDLVTVVLVWGFTINGMFRLPSREVFIILGQGI